MNKSSRKQHAYFKKFLAGHSLCHSCCLNDNLMDNVKSWVQNQPEGKALFTISIHSAAPASTANTCAFMCTCAPVWSFLKWKWSCPPVCASTSPAEDLELTIMPQGVWCLCTCVCACGSDARLNKSFARDYTHAVIYETCNKIKLTHRLNITEGVFAACNTQMI